MVQRKRMGFGGLLVGISVVVMFWVTDALQIGGRWSADEGDVLEDPEACAGLRDAATGVMQARQGGAARALVSDVLAPLGEDGEVMLALAYAYPVHDALEDKEQAVVEFAEGIHATCLDTLVP